MRVSCKCGGARVAIDGSRLEPAVIHALIGSAAVAEHAFYECNQCGEIATQRRRGAAQFDSPRMRATTIEVAETLLATLDEMRAVLKAALEQIK